MSPVLSAATGWLLFAGLTLSLGAVVARWAIIPHVDGETAPRDWLTKAVGGVAAFGATVLSAAMALFLLRQVQEFRDPFAPWTDEAWLLLSSTAWGRTWFLAATATLTAVWATRVARAGRELGWWVATPVLLLLGTFPAYTGHAAGEEEIRVLALAADWIHVWSASAWIGGLAVVLYIERRWRQERGPEASVLPTVVPLFSRVAVLSVAALVVTGTFASWLHLPSVSALFTTDYGRVLLLKLLLAAAVLALGGVNSKILTPRLGRDEGRGAMRKSAIVELTLAQLVLVVTAVLVRTSPMGH